MQSKLKWHRVTFSYDGYFEMKPSSYALHEGDFTLFFGPNGAGKTTFFKIGMGLLSPASGQVLLEEKPLNTYRTAEIAQRIAYLEQEIHYLFPFTVEEIVLMGRFPHTQSHFWDRKEDLEIAAWAMEITGTLRFAKRSIFQLSGGEKRKVEIARAICQKPKILFLDEPTTFLDIKQKNELFELLMKLNQEERITIGLISHQLETARRYVRSAVFIQNGQIEASGQASDLLADNQICQFFNFTLSSGIHP